MENAGIAVCFGTARPVTMISLALTSQNGGPCFEVTGWVGLRLTVSVMFLLSLKRFSKMKTQYTYPCCEYEYRMSPWSETCMSWGSVDVG